MAKKGMDTTFDSLVTEMSTSERENMLTKMRQGQTSEADEPKAKDNSLTEDSAESDLLVKLRQESFFKQLWMWIKAAVTNTPVEEVFNLSIVSGYAKEIEREYAGVIDWRHRLLCSYFYDCLIQLKAAAEFFRPYLLEYEKDCSAFYILLGQIIMPETGKEIERQSDPYQYSFDKNITKEMRNSLILKLDRVLDDMSVQKKSEMYASVRGLEWLLQFVKLPLSRISAKFLESEENAHECPFAIAKSEFSDLTKIITNYTPITDEAIQALFLWTERNSKFSGFESIDENAGNGTEFQNSASVQYSVIRMFIQSIPMQKLSKVVFENSQYVPESYGGGEDWLVKFKSQWKLLFDRRWDAWNRDYKKEELKSKLLSYFDLASFPLFPFRPWEKVWGDEVNFRYQLTVGFIYSFFRNEYKRYDVILEVIGVEGDFSLRENRIEFTDTMNSFASTGRSVDLLADKLSAGGEYGLQFSKYENSEEHNISSRDFIKIIMEEIEDDASEIVKKFGKACRSMTNLLDGIMSEKITAYYGPLTNLMKLRGRENKAYREQLSNVRDGIGHAYELVKELEPIDMDSGR